MILGIRAFHNSKEYEEITDDFEIKSILNIHMHLQLLGAKKINSIDEVYKIS